jgi:hypothetical protein
MFKYTRWPISENNVEPEKRKQTNFQKVFISQNIKLVSKKYKFFLKNLHFLNIVVKKSIRYFSQTDFEQTSFMSSILNRLL